MFLKNVFNIAVKLNNHIIWKKHKINFLFRKNDAEMTGFAAPSEWKNIFFEKKKILPAHLQI